MRSVEWLAGLLEGEGHFRQNKSGSSGRYWTPAITLAMTDHDVVQEVQRTFVMIGGRDVNIHHWKLPSEKIAYTLYLTGLPAARVMTAILPHMGLRRRAKISSILAAWQPKKYRAAVQFQQAHMASSERGWSPSLLSD